MNLDNTVISIKDGEGFSSLPYIDPLVRIKLQKEDPKALATIEKYLPTLKLTAGYGTLLNLSQKEGTVLVRARLNEKIEGLKIRKPIFTQLPFAIQEVLAEMAYQMGVYKLLQFKKTWKYLEEHEFEKASYEMLDSAWYRQLHEADMLDGTDSVNRAEKLSQRVRDVAGY